MAQKAGQDREEVWKGTLAGEALSEIVRCVGPPDR